MKLEDYNVPQPAPVSPNIPHDTAAQLSPIDKMAQLVIPKLVDKLNMAEWKIARLEAAVQSLLDREPSIVDVRKAVDKKAAKKKPARKQQTALSSIADYNPDTDAWGPKTFGGFKLTGAVAENIIRQGSDDAMDVYPAELVSYVFALPQDALDMLKEQFPN